jgi:hypothetical protein
MHLPSTLRRAAAQRLSHGGFMTRPVRPAQARREPYSGKYPASQRMIHRPVDLQARAAAD